jgi:hypothetical protein
MEQSWVAHLLQHRHAQKEKKNLLQHKLARQVALAHTRGRVDHLWSGQIMPDKEGRQHVLVRLVLVTSNEKTNAQ